MRFCGAEPLFAGFYADESVIGRVENVMEEYHAIFAERMIQHPAVQRICNADYWRCLNYSRRTYFVILPAAVITRSRNHSYKVQQVTVLPAPSRINTEFLCSVARNARSPRIAFTGRKIRPCFPFW